MIWSSSQYGRQVFLSARCVRTESSFNIFPKTAPPEHECSSNETSLLVPKERIRIGLRSRTNGTRKQAIVCPCDRCYLQQRLDLRAILSKTYFIAFPFLAPHWFWKVASRNNSHFPQSALFLFRIKKQLRFEDLSTSFRPFITEWNETDDIQISFLLKRVLWTQMRALTEHTCLMALSKHWCFTLFQVSSLKI